jgi:hypothetical protein
MRVYLVGLLRSYVFIAFYQQCPYLRLADAGDDYALVPLGLAQDRQRHPYRHDRQRPR